MADEKNSRKYFVSGTVQGVGYRMFALREAQKLGVSGYTRNLRDGRVEIYARGTPEQLAQLKAALQRGPRLSSVSGVREENAQFDPRYGSQFAIEQDD